MKAMYIKILREGRIGPVHIFCIPLKHNDENIQRMIIEAIEGIIDSVITKAYNDNSALKVDIKVKYDTLNNVYSFMACEDKNLSNLKKLFLENEKLQSFGIQQLTLKKTV